MVISLKFLSSSTTLLFICLAVLGLHCREQPFSLVAVCGALIPVTFLVAEPGLLGTRAQDCGGRSQELWLVGSRIVADGL